MNTIEPEINPRYTSQNPDLKGFNLAAMADLGAHADGSGGGIQCLSWEMGRLRELRERIALLDAFVRKHQLLLGRLSWTLDATRLHPTKKQGEEKDIGVFVPEIEVCSYAYDKRRNVTPKEIAALWPNAEWRRSKNHWDSKKERDYTADVDGVVVRIKNAERAPREKEVDLFKPCGRIKISSVNETSAGADASEKTL